MSIIEFVILIVVLIGCTYNLSMKLEELIAAVRSSKGEAK